MKKLLLYLILLLPLAAGARQLHLADTVKGSKLKLEGFAQVGGFSELWVLSSKLGNGVSSLSYPGTGGFAGLGFNTKLDAKHWLGAGLSADYLGYVMDKSLTANELGQTKYAFARLSPSLYFRVKTHSVFTFHWCAAASLLLPMHARENKYYELGVKACVGYKAFVLNLGYAFSKSDIAPSTLIITDGWRGQSFSAALVCYPSRLPGWGSLKAKLKKEFKH